jgi:hypothetical protein
MLNLQTFLEENFPQVDEDAEEGLLDAKRIIARAKERGLIMTQPEARAVVVAVNGRRHQVPRGHKAAEIDKSGLKVETSLAGVKTGWMDVTPAMAELWLKNNFNNRTISIDTVRAYARDMSNKKWVPNHQGIAFNNRDELIDGQHRLTACVACGKTFRSLVTFGLPCKIDGTRMTGMDTVDRGKTRSVADQLKIQHGIGGGTVLAMICARLAGLCSPERTRRLSVGEVLDIHETFETSVDWVIERRPKAHGLKQAGVLAAFAFAIAAESEVMGFWEKLMSNAEEKFEEECDEPMHHLRQFLTGDAAILLTRGNDRALAELVLQAIWQQRLGERVESLEPGLDGVEYYRDLLSDRVEKIAAMFALPDLETSKK